MTEEKKLRLKIIGESDVTRRLVVRALAGHDDIEVMAEVLSVDALDLVDPSTLPDVFLVSMNDTHNELTATYKASNQLQRPVIVFGNPSSHPGYETTLMRAGAFEILDKTPPKNANQGAYFRRLGTKLAATIRSAEHVQKTKAPNRGRAITEIPPRDKLPLSGKPAKALLVVVIGADSIPLTQLMPPLKKLPGLAVLVLHQIPKENLGDLINRLNAGTDYHVSFVQDKQPLSEHELLIAVPGRHLTVDQDRRLFFEPRRGDEAAPDPAVFAASMAKVFGRDAVVTWLGEAAAEWKKQAGDLIGSKTVILVEQPSGKGADPAVPNVRLMPLQLLALATRRVLSVVLGTESA